MNKTHETIREIRNLALKVVQAYDKSVLFDEADDSTFWGEMKEPLNDLFRTATKYMSECLDREWKVILKREQETPTQTIPREKFQVIK
jgi:hypothetical protein